MKHYSTDLEHGVQPNYHPSTQAVKSDYSLASQWVVQTSPPPNSQMKVPRFFILPPSLVKCFSIF